MSGSEDVYDFSPATPTENRRSRYEQFNTPGQSPMIKIAEDDAEPDEAVLPPGNSSYKSKRFSGNFGSPMVSQSTLQPPPSLYSLDNNSSSSILNIPGGNIAGNRSSVSSLKYAPLPSIPMRNKSPSRYASPTRHLSPSRNRSPSPKKQPFNFKSTNLNAPPSLNNPRASHRKGHRYKHSSVSMNLFQEPKLRAPLKIPTAFPIPDYKEFFSSCSNGQKFRLSWTTLHLSLSLITFLLGFKYSLHSLSTLSHLMFYDCLACLAIVFVDIMGNFDVWKKSSIKYPFGLGRIEILFGFALSISLIFVGCDLVSHFVEETMISFLSTGDSHESLSGHNSHATEAPIIDSLLYEVVVISTIITTLISSRIVVTESKNLPIIPSLSTLKQILLYNPTHIITLVFSGYLSVYPFILNLNNHDWINDLSTLTISLLICYMGWKVIRYLGYIVLLSFPGINDTNSVSNTIIDQIQQLNLFKSNYKIKNLIVSQVHMSLVIVLIQIKMIGGSDDDEVNLRYQIQKILTQNLQKLELETTIDIDRI